MNLMSIISSFVNRYNEEKFWKMYFECQNNKAKGIKRFFYIYRIKRIQAIHGSDFMVIFNKNRNFGAYFANKPRLPHGLKGIIISDQAKIGKNAVIFQQVTIGIKEFGGKAPTIKDNVFIGAGAKILGDIVIGNNVKIGANAVVLDDVPDNCTVGGVPAKIISSES